MEELQKVKGGSVQRKTGPVDGVISATEPRGTCSQCLRWFLPSAVFGCFCLDLEVEPSLCSIPNSCCPRSPLFVDKKPEGLQGKSACLFSPLSQIPPEVKKQGPVGGWTPQFRVLGANKHLTRLLIQ